RRARQSRRRRHRRFSLIVRFHPAIDPPRTKATSQEITESACRELYQAAPRSTLVLMNRFLLAISFGALAAITLFRNHGDAQPNTVKQIVPGVWFREGDLDKEGHCNNVIIEMKDYLIVVDANFPSGARPAMQDAKKVSTKPVKYVFDTHHHGDHLYGNPIWTKTGAITLAYTGVADELKRYEPARWQDTAKQRKDVGDLNL